MDIKVRLQRVLQIVEGAECAGGLSELDKDIALNELREVYAELKFGVRETEELKTENENAAVAAVADEPLVESEENVESEEESDEPEVEVELVFDENEEEDAENEEVEAENEEVAEVSIVETPNTPNASNAPNTPNAPIVEEKEEELSSLVTRLSSNKRSPLLSLYEDAAPQEVVGDTFHEKPSVGDTISCPKGVAESAPIASLRGAIGVADRFMLVRELFGGDVEAFERAIDNLDHIGSLDDCMIYIAENYEWRAQSEGAKLVVELLQRKFKA